MLHFHTLSNAAGAKAYFRSADYHFEGADKGAYWLGKGADLLGLHGPADPLHFERLIDNDHPLRPHLTLTGARRDDRKFARDMTVSLPKSVSLARSIGGDERIDGAVDRALAKMFAVMERDTETRVRKKGADFDRNTGNLVACVFAHRTSRPIRGEPDPQEHRHVVILNLTLDKEEGEWKAVQFKELLRHSGYYNAVFRSELAGQLQQLGYEVTPSKDAFEIVGIPATAIKDFSRRTTQIDKLADTLGIRNPESKSKLGATSREAKSKGLGWDDLVERWRNRAKPADLQAIDATRAEATVPYAVVNRDRDALDWAVHHAFERDSVVGQRELVTHALKHGLGQVTLEGIYEELGRRKDLIRRKVNGREMVSTQGVLSEEKRITAFAVKGRGRCRPLASRLISKAETATLSPSQQAATDSREQGTNSVVSQNGAVASDKLSPSQAAAVRHVWTSPDRLILIRGAAGTGKTTLTKAALAGVNAPWVILAPSAEASRGVLVRDGFKDADTLARFLVDEKMQEKVRGGLIWLDEASLAGAHDLARLIESADRLNARVVLSGDRRQHKSVARGDVLALLEDRAGLPVAEVSEIRRQSGEYKEAVQALAKGDVAEGFAKLDALGWVKESGMYKNGEKITTSPDLSLSDNDSHQMHAMIAEDYLAAIQSGKSVLTIAPTHAEGEKVTAAIREKLKQDGRLRGEEKSFDTLAPLHWTEAEKADPARYTGEELLVFHRNCDGHRAGERCTYSELRPGAVRPGAFGVFRREKRSLQSGDAVRITANGKSLDGHRLNNGAVYSVSGFTDKGDIKLNNGWVVSKDFAHLSHGYVSTSHAAQGRTVDVALIAMGNESLPAMGSEQFYVSASRARFRTQIYVEDKAAVMDAIQRDDTRLLASDLVRQPRRGLRDRLKKHLGFLRRVATLGRDREHTLQPPLEMSNERT